MMAASTPSTFVDLCATEGLSGAGSSDADFKTYLLDSAVTLPPAASGNSAAHRKARKEMAFTLLWLRGQLGNTDALTALPPAMQQSAKDIYPMRADQRSSPT